MVKVYIAGPMTGLPDFNRPAFFAAAEVISAGGDIPLNPAILPSGLEQFEYMGICIAMLQNATHVYVLHGWEHSKGARAELALAEKLGLCIEFQGDHK